MSDSIGPADNYARKRVKVFDSEMAYIDTGGGDPIVFLHGNPTSSYLRRNVIPHLEGLGRRLAPDLVGKQREFCRAWPNQTEVTVKGSHFVQEDSPGEIGQAVAEFVQKNRG